jgi:hypothetical protein
VDDYVFDGPGGELSFEELRAYFEMADSTGQRNEPCEMSESQSQESANARTTRTPVEGAKADGLPALRQRWRLIDIGREIGCTAPMVGKMVREHKHLEGHPFGWEPRAGCLSIVEREQIMVGIGGGESLSAIARDLGRSASTIAREVTANGGRDEYSAWRAHEHARGEARRPKLCKLGSWKVAGK